MVQKYKMQIEKITSQTEDSKTFIFVPTDNDQGLFNYLPGQFFLLEAEITRPKIMAYDKAKKMMAGSGENVRIVDKKAFSVVTSPTEAGYIELLVKSERGVFAPYFLEQARAGDICTFTGPQGNFMKNIFQRGEKAVACWSSGSGIPSTVSLMKFVLDNGLATKIIVFDSNKSMDDIIFHDRIKNLIGQSDNFIAVFTNTRESTAQKSNNPNIFYSNGRFWSRENTLEKYAGSDWKNYFNTICGSSSFINGKSRDERGLLTKLGKGAEDNLLEVGVPATRIDKDQFYLQ